MADSSTRRLLVYRFLLACAGVSGVGVNLLVSQPGRRTTTIVGIVVYVLPLVVLALTYVSRYVRRHTRALAIGIAYLVSALDLTKIALFSIADVPMWMGMIVLSCVSLIGVFARRWQEVAAYGMFALGLIVWYRLSGWIDGEGTTIIVIATMVGAVTMSIAAHTRIGAERSLIDSNSSLALALEEAEQLRDTAERAARTKSEFLATMSHEIRTPLNGVIGMADLLVDSPLDSEQTESVETIRTSADALLSIIGDVLDFSKIEAGRVEIESIPMEPERVARTAVRVVRVAAHAKGLALRLHVADDVPDFVLGDPNRLGQVLLNLLSNAVKFTESGSVTLSLAVEPSAEVLVFAVEDTGIGMTADACATIFDSFTQADASTTRQYGGTGLGLTISARLAELMGGSLSVESAPGAGSTFTARVRYLPVAVAKPPRAPISMSDGPPMRILIADDNAVNLKVAVRMAERLGHLAVTVGDGQSAVDAARDAAQPYDVVLMDVHMPGMDGYAAARLIADEVDTGGPFIALLTADAVPDPEAFAHSRASAFATKPLRIDALRDLLSRGSLHSDAARAAHVGFDDRPPDRADE